MNVIPKNVFWVIFCMATVVYVIGLFVMVMDVDAAQYASISREMLNNHQYLKVLYNHENYLDKPPLLFWLSVLSFKIFGVSTWAYKLPSFLFTVTGVYATFRLTKRFYNEQTALVAVIFLYTCQAYFLFNNDVRTDTLLTAASVFATWQLFIFYEEKKFLNLLFGFTGVAVAMMAKGPIGAVVPASALVSQITYKRDWKKLFQWQWFFGIFLAFVLMSPMLYGLYEQYGSEGPKFFLWTQSFGRITGENVWKNDAGYFFFVHTFLWAFLPWSLLAVIALISNFGLLISQRFRKDVLVEVFSMGGFILPFIALSFSHYKLPHYIFVVFPFGAIICAGFLNRVMERDSRLVRIYFPIQIFSMVLLWLIAVALCSYVFPMINIICWIILAAILLTGIYFFRKGKTKWQKLILASACTMIGINFLLNAQVYPSLLNYQSGSSLAEKALANHADPKQIFFFKDNINSFEFYFGSVVPVLDEAGLQQKVADQTHCWLIGGDDLMNALQRDHVSPVNIFSSDDFAITRLNFQFLDPEQRLGQLKKKYLVEI